ncbi:hypothetical protein TNIN_424971 [Trichonephila inaurata madagascariensis]|uniref:Uncharacterized protein n=1 Tax=Trichonephila inaurata madagascariensis TaxID=2747483 RepID=A0A8X6WUB3_9ARAC|nr:hypothetical protein TNIN_424971 [Trichonephila inaurata madagascariensis]
MSLPCFRVHKDTTTYLRESPFPLINASFKKSSFYRCHRSACTKKRSNSSVVPRRKKGDDHHRRRQDVVATFPNAPRHERRLECRATTLLSRRRYSVVPRRKSYEHLPPRSRCRMSLSCFRVHKDMTGGTRPHFGFSAFLTWSVLDVHRDTASYIRQNDTQL